MTEYEPPRLDAPPTRDGRAPAEVPVQAAPQAAPGDARENAPRLPTLGERLRAAPVTLALIVANVTGFIWESSLGDTTKNGVLLAAGASEQLHVWSGEYWRLVTPMFLHVGVAHLLWNLYAGFGWCSLIESVLGRWRFLAVYFASGVGGAAMTVIARPVVSAGASGAMFGIVGATVILRRRMLPSWKAMAEDPPSRSLVGQLLLWGLIGIGLGVDNYAHFGGFITGAAMTWILTARSGKRGGWTAFALGFAGLVIAAMHPGWKPTPAQSSELLKYAARDAVGADDWPKNEARAAKFFRLACEGGSPQACAAMRSWAPSR